MLFRFLRRLSSKHFLWVLILKASICFAEEKNAAEYAILTATQTVSDVASSERMRELYPGTKLYGSGGRLQLLLKLNPTLRNGQVAPGKKILLIEGSQNYPSTVSRPPVIQKVGLLQEEIVAIKMKITDVQTYLAQLGDTMSSIAQRFFSGTKLYGSGGRLELLLKLNPHIEDQNTIYPGDLILIDPRGELKQEIEKRQIASTETKEKVEIPVEMKTAPVAEEGISYFNFSTGGSFFRIDSRDFLNNSSGALLSTLSPHFKLSWEPQLDQKIFLSMGVETSLTQWQNPVGREIQNRQESLSGAYFSMGHRSLNDSRALFTIKQEEMFVPRAVTTNLIRLEKAHSTNLGTDLQFNIMKKGPFQFDGIVALGLSSGSQSGDLKIKQGYYYDLGLEFSQNFKKYQIKSGIQYSKKDYNTNFSDNESTQLQFLFGLSFKLEE